MEINGQTLTPTAVLLLTSTYRLIDTKRLCMSGHLQAAAATPSTLAHSLAEVAESIDLPASSPGCIHATTQHVQPTTNSIIASQPCRHRRRRQFQSVPSRLRRRPYISRWAPSALASRRSSSCSSSCSSRRRSGHHHPHRRRRRAIPSMARGRPLPRTRTAPAAATAGRRRRRCQ